jgi:hypothetical protein
LIRGGLKKWAAGVQRYFALRLLYHTPETLERAGKKIAFSLFMCRRRVQKLFPLADKTGKREKKKERDARARLGTGLHVFS